MPTPSLTLWIDSNSSRLVSGWQASATASSLVFNQGDNVGIELHRVNAINGNFMSEVLFPETGNITLAIGNIESAPTSGTYTLKYGTEETSTLNYNATASDIQTAINDLAGITSEGGVTVSPVGNSFRVKWVNATAPAHALSVGSKDLFPTSSIAIETIRAGSLTVNQLTNIHIKQSPVALCSTWVNQDPSTATITQIHTPQFVGDVKVWRLVINPQPKSGTFLLSYQYGSSSFRTQPLDINSSPAVIQTALAGLNGNLESFSVTQSGSYSWDISTDSSSVLNFNVTSAGIVSFNSKYGILNLNTIEIADLLAGSSSVSATVEVQLESEGTTTTLFQGTCTIINDLIDNDGVTIVNRGDVMPVESVVRYDTAQSLNNSQKTQARTNISAIGSSDLVPFTNKDNELETRLIVAENNLISTDQKNALNGSSSPSGSNVFITTSALTSALTAKANISHTHAISDVTSLQYNLDLLQSNINAINNVSLSANNLFTGTQRFNNKVGINTAPDNSIGLALDATGVIFSDGSIQTTAALPSTGGTITGDVTLSASGNTINIKPSLNSLSITSGTSSASFSLSGLTFSNGSTQTTAGLPMLGGGNVVGTVSVSNEVYNPDNLDHFRSVTIYSEGISCGGDTAPFFIDGSNGLRFADDNTLTRYTSSGITFSDNTTQTTAAFQFNGGSIENPITFGDGSVLSTAYPTIVVDSIPIVILNGTAFGGIYGYPDDGGTANITSQRLSDGTQKLVWSVTQLGNTYTGVEFTSSLKTWFQTSSSYDNLSWDNVNKVVSISNFKNIVNINQGNIIFSDGTIQNTAWTSSLLTPYAQLSGATFTGVVNLNGNSYATTQSSSDSSTKLATTAFVKNQGYSVLSGGNSFSGTNTFTGKVNANLASTTVAPLNITTGVSPSAPVNGDVWIGTTNLAYRDSTGVTRTTVSANTGNNFTQNQTITVTSAGSPSLNVIQNGNGGGLIVTNVGTGYSFKVEDAASPDATPFVIDASGRTGIGIAPDATAALNVDSTGIKFNSSTAQTVPFLPPPSDGNYYVYRNGAWTMATIYVSGGRNYLTI